MLEINWANASICTNFSYMSSRQCCWMTLSIPLVLKCFWAYGFLKPRFPTRSLRGVCPPSNPSLGDLPVLAFCPLCPRPAVLPRPDPIPRPTRFGYSRIRKSAYKRSCNSRYTAGVWPYRVCGTRIIPQCVESHKLLLSCSSCL